MVTEDNHNNKSLHMATHKLLDMHLYTTSEL